MWRLGDPSIALLPLPLKLTSGADLLQFGVSRLLICVLLASGTPTGRFHSFRKIYQILVGNLPLLSLNVWDAIELLQPLKLGLRAATSQSNGITGALKKRR